MKYITIDRIVVMILTAAIGFIHQRQSIIDESQDKRMYEFFIQLQSATQTIGDTIVWPIDSSISDVTD